jgi:hypothetical protein
MEMISREEEQYMKDLSRKLVVRATLESKPVTIDIIDVLSKKFRKINF